MAHAPAASETAAMAIPSRMISPKGAPEVPRLSISATRVGMNRAPATSMISRTTVSRVSFRWGLRKRSMSFMGYGLLSKNG